MRAVAADERFDWFHGTQPMLPTGAHPAIAAASDYGVPIASVELPRAGSVPPPPRDPYAAVPQSLVPSPMATPMPAAPPQPLQQPAVQQPAVQQPAVQQPVAAANTATGSAPPVPEGRGGLSRRVPGRNLPSGTAQVAPRAPVPADPAPVDPAVARAEAEAFTQGFARGVASVPGTTQRRDQPDGQQPAALHTPPAAPPQWPLAVPAQRSAPAEEQIEPAGPPAASSAPESPTGSVPAGFEPDEEARYPLPPRRVPGNHSRIAPQSDRSDAGSARQPVTAPVARLEEALTRRVPGSHLADELRLPGAVPLAPGGMPLVETGTGPAGSPADRDPDAEQHQLAALVAGFARGDAAVQNGDQTAQNGAAEAQNADAEAQNADAATPTGNGGAGRSGPAPNSGPTVQFPQTGQPVQNGQSTNGDSSPTYQFNNGAQAGAEPQNVERR
jgi:hypothetical protein